MKKKKDKDKDKKEKGLRGELKAFGKRRVKVPKLPKAWKKRMVVKLG